MSTDGFARLEALFGEALAQPVEQRDGWVAGACGENEELAGELRSLLAAHAATGSPLDAASGRRPALEIDRYRVLRELGTGGMGSVFLAEQLEPIRREVAIKVVRLGMDSERVLERFAVERQALALMNHDHIARVLDAGTTPRGQPYFVMEHVPGPPLDRFCDQHALALRDRIELFLGVCAGVQHAHQKGILHRDLKPSNLLVTGSAEQGMAKIIDFGLARAIDRDELQATLSIESDLVLGTPEFMSPEQAGAEHLDIDTRTDVYSLGVVLSQLLTGLLPFPPEWLRQLLPTELLRTIREVDAPAPSRRFAEASTAEQERSATCRATTPVQLQRALRGDLDWIVGRATEKDRDRRYQTVAEFADDLRRHLDNEPVRASPPSTFYRLRKLVRRHRGKAAAAAALVAALLLGLTTTLLGFAEAAQQRDLLGEKVREFDLLATIEQLAAVRQRREPLVPAWPSQIGSLSGWLDEEARPLAARLQVLREAVRDLEQRSAAGRSESQEFLLRTLSEAVLDLQVFTDNEIPAVEAELRWARSLAALPVDHPAARVTWAAAAAALRAADGVVASSSYREVPVELLPQPGLVPIGMNPRTGLWEFYQLRSDAAARPSPAEVEIPVHAADGSIEVADGTGIVFVLIPGGTFMMGQSVGDVLATDDEVPAHEVTLAPFFLARHEMTQGQWARLASGARPSQYHSSFVTQNVKGLTDAHPVEQISWSEATRVLRAHGLALPTEAQWEYAARGGGTACWSDGGALRSLLGAANLFDRRGEIATNGDMLSKWPGQDDGYPVHAPVDAMRPNAFGLHHVHGNVWEWCVDALAHYSTAIEPGRVDGLRAVGVEGEPRIQRGGSFLSGPNGARVSFRSWVPASSVASDLGVRAARPLQ